MSHYDHLRATPKGLRPGVDVPKWLWLAPAIALLIAILPLPYGYYTLLRVGVTAAATFLAWREYEGHGRRANSYVWIFGAVALLYNPILPVHLSKLIWIPLNLVTAATFAGHYKLRQAQS